MADYSVKEKETVKETKPHAAVAGPKTPREVLERERAEKPVIAVEAHLAHNIDEPFPEPLPVTPPTPEAKKAAEAKAEVLKKLTEILAKYDNRESSIPPNSEYWTLVNQYRTM